MIINNNTLRYVADLVIYDAILEAKTYNCRLSKTAWFFTKQGTLFLECSSIDVDADDLVKKLRLRMQEKRNS